MDATGNTLGPNEVSGWERRLGMTEVKQRAPQTVLVRGAEGWIGREIVNQSLQLGFAVASVSRQGFKIYEQGKDPFEKENLSWPDLVAFAPRVMIDCAFITKERTAEFGLAGYVRENKRIISQIREFANLPSISEVSYISSGAASQAEKTRPLLMKDPYGVLKLLAEDTVESLVNSGTIEKTTIWRVWSVAGTRNPKPAAFALSSFIRDAFTGVISVESRRRVWRRYVWLPQLAAVIAKSEPTGKKLLVDSGGELVELRELARQIGSLVGARVDLPPLELGAQPDCYFASPTTWNRVLEDLDLENIPLETQLRLLVAEQRG